MQSRIVRMIVWLRANGTYFLFKFHAHFNGKVFPFFSASIAAELVPLTVTRIIELSIFLWLIM